MSNSVTHTNLSSGSVNVQRSIETAIALFETTFIAQTDFTRVYPDRFLEQFGEEEKNVPPEWWRTYCERQAGKGKLKMPTSFEFSERLFETDARLQVSRAYCGEAWTVSVRWNPGDAVKGRLAKAVRSDVPANPKWRAPKGYGLPAMNGGPFLFSIDEVVECLWDMIRIHDAEPLGPGLVLVTGTTNSSKSLIARGLVWKHLENALKSLDHREGRWPHLVTYEDPIEKLAVPLEGEISVDLPGLPAVDYTPRQPPIDCKDLDEVCNAALRQTPSAVYIGELREPKDIRRAVDFAGTGHLVVATGHAGNLIESAEKIFRAVGARDPGTRALYVPKIQALIHMRRLEQKIAISGIPVQFTGLVPTLYRRTTRGMQGLIADGLFSLIPYYSESDDDLSHAGCLGRQYLVRRLGQLEPDLSKEKPRTGSAENFPYKNLRKNWKSIRQWNYDRRYLPPKSGTLASPDSDRLINLARWDDLNGL
jgi:hypothetical protein